MTGFIDTNIFIYAISDHPEYGEKSRKILQRVEDGEKSITSTMVLSEIAWVFEARGSQAKIKETFEKILSYQHLTIITVTPDDLIVGATHMQQYGLDFNDGVNLAIIERTMADPVYTNDKKHLGRVEHIETIFE